MGFNFWFAGSPKPLMMGKSRSRKTIIIILANFFIYSIHVWFIIRTKEKKKFDFLLMNNYADRNRRLKQTLNSRGNAFLNELVQVWQFLQLLLQKNQTHLDYLCKFWIPISVFGNLWGFNALLDMHHQHGVIVFLEPLMFSHIVSSC